MESVIVSLAIVALCVTIIPVLSLKAKLPGIVGVFLAGLILGPYGLGVIAQEYDWLSCLALLGIIFLMFLAGFETKLSELKQELHHRFVVRSNDRIAIKIDIATTIVAVILLSIFINVLIVT